jgi:anti-sigma factor RsiW
MSSDTSRDEGCTAPPALCSTALIAAADGEADEATMAHLRQCPHCAACVAQIRAVQARLLRRLYRLHCPSSGLLADYCQGLLDPYQRATLTHHLSLCPHCAAELELLERSALSGEGRALGDLSRLGVSLT